jgi:hypothetical protein
VALFEESFSKMEVIIDLTVKRDPDGPVLIRHGLVTGSGKVYDAQPPMAEGRPYVATLIESKIVRTTMRDRIAHRRYDCALIDGRSSKRYYSGYAAHMISTRRIVIKVVQKLKTCYAEYSRHSDFFT